MPFWSRWIASPSDQPELTPTSDESTPPEHRVAPVDRVDRVDRVERTGERARERADAHAGTDDTLADERHAHGQAARDLASERATDVAHAGGEHAHDARGADERVVARPAPPVADRPAAAGGTHWQARALDLLTDSVLAFSAQGEVVYRNAAASSLDDEEEGLDLHREARALALAVLTRATRLGAAGAPEVRELVVGALRFRIAAALVPASPAQAGTVPAPPLPAIVVTISRTSPPLPSPAALRSRFQLTAREASVALLLAEGRSNAGIARKLGISANTVRHYIETVLLKLGVRSRAAVAAAMLGVYESTDEHPVTFG